jgi:ribosomal protein S26
MKEVTITCDRCGKVVRGLFHEDKEFGKITAGFYDVSDGFWSHFKRWEEELVCDECMHACPKYKAIYSPS